MRYILLATATLFLTACGGGPSSPTPSTPTTPTPTAPAPTAPSPTGSSPTTNWTVTHRFVSVTGAENCWVQRQRASLTGVVFPDLEMTVTRSSGAITIQSPWFVDIHRHDDGGRVHGAADVTLLKEEDCRLQRDDDHPASRRLRLFQDVLPRMSRLCRGPSLNVYPLNTGETVTYQLELASNTA